MHPGLIAGESLTGVGMNLVSAARGLLFGVRMPFSSLPMRYRMEPVVGEPTTCLRNAYLLGKARLSPGRSLSLATFAAALVGCDLIHEKVP